MHRNQNREEESMDFKNKLILIYFNNLTHSYNPVEIIKLLKVGYEHVYDRVTYLTNEGYLSEEEWSIVISEQGRDYLKSNFLNNVSFNSISDRDAQDNNQEINSHNHIYIPKDFHKKV